MNIETWRSQYQNVSKSKQSLQSLIKQINANIIKEKENCYSYGATLVSGTCLTTDCLNFYEKTMDSVVQIGPFCTTCLKHARMNKAPDPSRKLLKTERPDVYDAILRCEIDKDLLTIGSTLNVVCTCGNYCLRCKIPHEWETEVRKMALPNQSRFKNCPFCCGNKNCECQKEDEFKCYVCKEIKNKTEKSGSGNRCKLCNRKMYDGDLKRFIHYVWRRTVGVMKMMPRKQGDLTEEYLLELYDKQEGRCHISGIEMSLGTYHNWQLSVERLNESEPYNKDNVVLIIRELQHGMRQHTRENWDALCAVVMGECNDDVEEIDKMIQAHINLPEPKLPLPPKFHNLEKREGQRYCKFCNQWLMLTDFTLKSNSCKACRNVRKEQMKSTFHGRLRALYNNSKENHVKRRIDFSITENDIVNTYLRQHGRCYYSNVPLGFTGHYQMSLERLDPKKGYVPENIALIILGLNVGDWTRVKREDDTRDGSSGWSRDKIMEAVRQNPRPITPTNSSVIEILKSLFTGQINAI